MVALKGGQGSRNGVCISIASSVQHNKNVFLQAIVKMMKFMMVMKIQKMMSLESFMDVLKGISAQLFKAGLSQARISVNF